MNLARRPWIAFWLTTFQEIVSNINKINVLYCQKRRRTLCDKRDNKFVWKKIPVNLPSFKQTTFL